MQKFLAVVTALSIISTVILGMMIYLGIEGVVKYHLVAALLTLVLVLTVTHRIFYSKFK